MENLYDVDTCESIQLDLVMEGHDIRVSVWTLGTRNS